MLRVYSVMQLEHVWAKPMDVILEEPQVISPSSHSTKARMSTMSAPAQPIAIHDEPEDYIEELSSGAASPTSDDEHFHSSKVESVANVETMNEVTADFHSDSSSSAGPASIQEIETASAAAALSSHQHAQESSTEDEIQEIVVEETKQDQPEVVSRNLAPVKNEEYIKELPPPQSPAVEPRYASKRDSKISTSSSPLSSIAEERRSLSGKVASILTRTRSHKSNTYEEHAGAFVDDGVPPIPPMPKPSRSAQIQAKVSAQRKKFSRKLKRTFSVHASSSSNADAAAKNKRATL